MHYDPLVSVIITAYNKETSIDKCIDSALRQSYHNVEIIVVDDCSTDNTLELIKKYNRDIILVANKENIGLPASRIVGFKHSQGDYITYIDGDDYLDYQAVKKALRQSADVIQMMINYRFSRLNIPLQYSSYYNVQKALEAYLYNENLFPVSCWGKLYRRHLIENAQFIDYDGFWGEDRLFGLAILDQNPTIAIASDAFYNYCYGGDSTKIDINNYSEYAKIAHLKTQWAKARNFDTVPIEYELDRLRDYHIRRLILSGKYTKEQIIAHIRDIVDDPDTAIALYRRNRPSLSQRLTYHIENLL